MIREIIGMRNEWQQTFGNPPASLYMNKFTWDIVFKELKSYTREQLPPIFTDAQLGGMVLKIINDMKDGDVILGD
jgi:hypothetical protein